MSKIIVQVYLVILGCDPALVLMLQGRAFRQEPQSIPGYKAGETGKMVARLRKSTK